MPLFPWSSFVVFQFWSQKTWGNTDHCRTTSLRGCPVIAADLPAHPWLLNVCCVQFPMSMSPLHLTYFSRNPGRRSCIGLSLKDFCPVASWYMRIYNLETVPIWFIRAFFLSTWMELVPEMISAYIWKTYTQKAKTPTRFFTFLKCWSRVALFLASISNSQSWTYFEKLSKWVVVWICPGYLFCWLTTKDMSWWSRTKAYETRP